LLRASAEAESVFEANNTVPEAPATIRLDLPIDESAGTLVGRYKLLQKIGEGGMGVVYMAEQTEPVTRKVALKIIKLGMDTRQVVARFEAERQALAMMDHPNIARVLDAGATESGRPYFVMELVQGVPVTEYCDKAKLPAKERLKIFIQVCQAVQSAHQKGIIHRDLKPSNILVTLHHGEPMPKVIDFGIAKATNQKLTEKTLFTQHATMIGTPAYMSPEQAEISSLDVDTRTDIYSLGVLLYELLTGSTPFPEKRLRSMGYGEMQRVIADEEPERPSTRLSTMAHEQKSVVATNRGADLAELGRQLRGDLDWVVMRCLEKDRRRRYETANGLAADIQRHLSNEPVTARPPSAAYKLQKFVRRNKLAFVAAAAVIVALVAGLSLATIGFVQARLQRNQAVAARKEAERAIEKEVQQRQRVDELGRLAEERRRQAEEGKDRAQKGELQARQRAYGSDINLAQQSLDAGKLGLTLELLNQPDLKDQRGWEWRYLWQQSRNEALSRLCRLERPIAHLAASPDGRWLAVLEGRSRLRLWDLATRQPVAEFEAADNPRPVFSPKRNLLAYSGGFLFATNRAGVRIWDPVTRQQVAQFPGTWCRGIEFSADEKTLVICSAAPVKDRETGRMSASSYGVTCWGFPEGGILSTFTCDDPPLYDNAGVPFAISGDARLAAIGGYSGEVILANLETGEEVWRSRGTDGRGYSLAFSPDGKTLAAGTSGSILLLDLATGAERHRLTGHRSQITALTFLPDGRRLASASYDQTVGLWDLNDPTHIPAPRLLRGHKLEVWTLALLADGRTLASGSKDGEVLLWNSDSEPREPYASLEDLPLDATWCLSGAGEAVVGAHLGTRELLEWRGPGQPLQRTPMPFDPGARRAVWSADGRFLAVGSTNGLVQVWEAATRSLTGQFSAGTHQVVPIQFDRENHQLAMVAGSAYEIWSVLPGRRVLSANIPAGCRIEYSGYLYFETAVSPDLAQVPLFRGDLIGDGGLLVWQPATDKLIELQVDPALKVAGNGITAVRFSPGADLLAMVRSATGIYDTRTGLQVAALSGFFTEATAVDFSPDGRRIAVGGDKGEIQVYQAGTWRHLMTLSSACDLAGNLRFSRDGDSIRVRGADLIRRERVERVRCWRVPSWEEIEKAEMSENKTQRH
jgi:eukaryotic-like serine/threonine-protein kinase